MQLTQKESMLLSDLKNEEQLCVEKYEKYAAQAHDNQLKELFTEISGIEKKHGEMLSQIESGNPPQVQAGGGSGPESKTFTPAYGLEETQDKQDDCFLCGDLLTAEKHASALYDTCVFEFKSQQARDVLNHIQKEEQNHGKALYDYMTVNSMY